jgi:ketosteroid isomerase-like protein/catechol 2,3-dioxygenase-like lactoylglutathione lyase family enzyme|tara:strand:+ start:269 stop:2113 length:1845 start_codon:yes stop_codon:yes gene_type:complete
MKQLILIFGLLIPVLTFAGNSAETNKYKKSSIELSNPIINDPLPVQMESKYVTDRSLWGRLIFDRYKVSGSYQRIEDKEKIMDLIETYHRHWLDGSNEELSALLDEEIIRFRGAGVTYGFTDVFRRIKNESRGERPSGYNSSMQLEIGDMQIHSEKNFSIALYSVAIRGGARWEYSDLATIFQVFHKVEDKWKIIGHIESFRLDNPNINKPSDSVPNRRASFTFDFVYPVKDLQRAIDFYSPLLGSPEIVTSTSASFRVGDSYFELDSEHIDDRISVINGRANGYGIINVNSLSNIRDKIKDLLNINIKTKSCGRAECLITKDSSGNIIIWRKYKPINTSQNKKPTIQSGSESDQPPVYAKLTKVISAWITNDSSSLIDMHTNKAVWIDDAYGIAQGKKQIKQALQSRWKSFDGGPNGINADVTTKNFQIRNIADRYLVTLEMSIDMRANPKRSFDALLTQVWKRKGLDLKLEHTFIAQMRYNKDTPVNGMDYTAYPVYDLGKAGRFYKNLFGSEPYRDENWFGFWSTTSVFGLVGPMSENSWTPIPNRSNGYADLSIGSAEEVYEYLKSKGSSFPVLEGINDTPGIDEQPGYNQILAIDSEGNLINFSEYLEY